MGQRILSLLRSQGASHTIKWHVHIPVDTATYTTQTDCQSAVVSHFSSLPLTLLSLPCRSAVEFTSVLLPQPPSRTVAGMYRFEAKPHGALSNLMPVSLPEAAATSGGSSSCPPGTVLLSVKAVGINFRDVLNVLGMYPGDPGAPGSDVAGVVVSSSIDSSLQPGTAVFGLTVGALGTAVSCSANTVVAMPPCLSFEAASSMPTVFITAQMALGAVTAVSSSEHVLVHAAAGGVGLAALQVLQNLGAVAVCTAGSPSKRSLLRSLSVSAVVGSRDSMFVGPLAAAGGVDVVLNSLTSPGMVAGSLSVLRRGGRFVEIGKRDIWAPAAVAAERPDVSYSLVAVDFMPASGLHQAMSKLSGQLAAGIVKPLPSAVHDISNIAAALRQMSQARHVGKVVVRQPTEAVPQLQQSPHGAVLVVGGTGTLGSLMVSWLSTQGVRHIPILSRTGQLSHGLQQLVVDPRAAAAQAAVSVYACDAALAADVVVLEQLLASGIPLLGVMHAGGVLRDATFSKQHMAGVRQVGASVSMHGALKHCCWSDSLENTAHVPG
eukprot:GHUV01035866.1.p1 GENE.GHUV01035866.1~~GHUV01035866.1.p1  ORF type:complete len:548 (-),score=177.63 GHUV01035866.1:22-1665(-)